MDINLTAEALLKQIGFTHPDETAINQMQIIIDNTKDFTKFSKHILALHDHLQHVHAFIAPSNSSQFLKIKMPDASSDAIVQEFHELVEGFATKYKVEIEKVPGKETYYIKGCIN
jgi:hypothetical protein